MLNMMVDQPSKVMHWKIVNKLVSGLSKFDMP